MTVKIDEPTGVNWNDTAANERERVGVVHIHVHQTPGLQKQVGGFSFCSLWATLTASCRDSYQSQSTPACFANAQHERGNLDILGLWMDDSEGAHRWMQVFDELRARGVEDVLYVSSDGVAGLGEGLASVFPRAVRRRCVVHLVRNSLRYVPQKEAAAFCRSVRAVYGAPSLAAAESAWEAFRGEWSRYPGAVAVWGRSLGVSASLRLAASAS